MANVIRFGCFEADLSARQLRKRGIRINLRDQCFEVLASLLEHPGEVVTREALQRRLWQDDVFVDFENNLNTAVARLREALCDSPDNPLFIETLPRMGYRFVARVHEGPASPPQTPAARIRMVVLPFVNLSGDPAQDYFSDAMTDELITALASLAPQQLAVIARTTAMHYKGSHKDVTRIGRELDVDYVVEGGVRRSEDQVAINVQLIQASDQTHLFARRYDAELRDVFRLYRSIAQSVATHIPTLTDSARAGGAAGESFIRKPTEDIAAYHEYLKGRHQMWKWTPESVARARQHFETAVARDPRFALAYASLAELNWYLGFWGFAPPEHADSILTLYVQRAVEIDPTLAETHLFLFCQERHHDDKLYNWLEVEKHMAYARDLNPNSVVVRVRHAMAEMVLARFQQAVSELEYALELDPLSLEVRGWLAEALFLGGQYDRALDEVRQLIELEPGHYLAYMMLGHVYLGMQKYEDSITALRKAVELSGGFPQMLGWLGLALGLAGHTAEARAVLERLHSIASQRYVPPTSFAWTHLGLGEINDAFIWMDQAADRRDRMIVHLNHYPFLEPYRADPRYTALLRKLNLER